MFSKSNKYYKILSKHFSMRDKPRIVKVNLDGDKTKITMEDYKPAPYSNVINQIRKVKIFGSESDAPTIAEDDPKEVIEDNIINKDQYFSDFCRIYVKAGDGGNGLFSIIKGHLFDQITPQGGDGGKGGDVIFEADANLNSLSYLRKAHYIGNSGDKGQIKSMSGRNGKDVIYRLPLGTLVYEIIRPENYEHKKRDLRADKAYETKLLIDMDQDGMKYIVCKGGLNGIGNYSKKNMRREDTALKGKLGDDKELVILLI
jgi:hypothetical protein